MLGTFQFLAKSLYPEHTGVAIFWLIWRIFSNVENTLPILLKHSKFCSFMKTIDLERKKHVLGTSEFSAKSMYPDITIVAFFGWFWVFFEIVKIPFQFFWNIQNFILPWKQSVWRKKSMFWVLCNLDQNRCIRTLPVWPFFFCRFFEMFKIPFQFFWNFQNFVLLWKQSLWRKKSMFWGLFNFWQNRCIRTLPAWPFFCWFWVFFEILKIPYQFFWNIQNFVLSWKQSLSRKKSMFWGLFNFRQNRCIRTLPVWPFFGWFSIFFICWKYPSNSTETFKILTFHENNRFEEKKACIGDFSILCIIAVSGPYRRGIFWLILSIFWNIENTLPILLKHSKFCSCMKTIGLKKKKHVFGDFSIFGKIALSGPYRRGIFLLILSIFWNVENTLPILLKHSKSCSFIKAISFKKKKHVLGKFQFLKKKNILGTLQLGPKSLYPDLTGVPFFGWFLVFFEILKIPFQFFRNIQNFVLSWKQSVWRNQSIFWGLFNF